MRVGLVIPGDLSLSSGGFLYDRRLVDSLRASGDSVDIIPLPWESWGRSLGHGARPSIRAALRGWRGDLLLEDELAHPSLFVLNRVLRPAVRGPIVSIVHHLRSSEGHPPLAHALSRSVERAYARSVDAFIFNSATTRRTVEALVGGPTPGIVVTPGGDRLCPGIVEDEVARRSAEPGPLRVLFVGNVIPRKRLPMLIGALSRVDRSQWRLTVIGGRGMDARHAAAVDRAVSAHGLEENIRMLGSVNDRDLARELGQNHVLVIPSQHEGFGIVYLEAMGFGVAPIATRNGGAEEIIEDGRSGLLVAEDDERALGAAIARLAADRALLSALGAGALRRYRELPGWERSMGAVRPFLLGLVEAREG